MESETQSSADESEYESYDETRWERAEKDDKADDREHILDEGSDDDDAPVPEPFDCVEEGFEESWKHPPNPTVSEVDFVRALHDSKDGGKPYYRKGDMLRVINKARRVGVGGESIKLLSS